MNKKAIGAVIIVVVVVIIIAAATSSKKSKTLTFGLISGRSGDYAAVGESFYKGAMLAQEQWNAGHPSEQVNMVAEDDGFDAKKGLSAYRKLTSIDHIDGLINMTTITIDALYDEVSKTGMPVALGFEQGIEAKNDNVVQLWPGSVPAEAELGKYIKDKGFKNVVLFVDQASSAFQRFAGGFKDGYGAPVTEVPMAADGKDYKSNALKAIGVNPDAIVFICKPVSGALLVKEIGLVAKKKYQYVFDADIQTGLNDYQKTLGNTNVLNGSILYVVPNLMRAEFNTAFKAKYGTDPAIGSETGYNAFMLLARSYDSDKAVWVHNMQTADFIGADGHITFDKNGVRIPELKIGTIENGKLPE